MITGNYKQRSLLAGNSKTKRGQIIKLTVATANGVLREEARTCTHKGCICSNCQKRTFSPFNLIRI